MNEISKYGLLNSLLSIINNYDESDSKVTIAKYFLRNIDRIDEINIFEAAEECFVTRTSIRRFAKFIGFDNFRNLKTDHESYTYYKNVEEVENYPVFLANQISQMVSTFSNLIGEEMALVTDSIKNCNEIIFLASDIYYSRCLEFQKQMILSGKIVRIVSYNFSESEVLKNITPTDLLIVISISGGFTRNIADLVRGIHCKKAIMTSIDDEHILAEYDLVLPVGEINQPSSKTIYHTFAAEYYLDVINYEYQKGT